MLERSSNDLTTVTLTASCRHAAVAGGRAQRADRRCPTDDETNRKNMELLIQLRWIAVVGQIVTIGGVHLWLRHSPAAHPHGAR